MKGDMFISILDVCAYCHVEATLLRDFAGFGLFEINVREQAEFIAADEIRKIKKIIDLYRGLGVNKEGIEIILDMRDRIQDMERELAMLRHRVNQLGNDCKFRLIDIPAQRGLLVDYDG
jgi:chaperone modulatory protein CbpM